MGIYDRGAGFISNFGSRGCLEKAFCTHTSDPYDRFARKKGKTAEGFFSVIGRRFWADAEYAADCHCCGALFNTPDWLHIKEIFICCCRRIVCCALLLEPFFKQALGRPNLCGICGKVDVQIIKIRKL